MDYEHLIINIDLKLQNKSGADTAHNLMGRSPIKLWDRGRLRRGPGRKRAAAEKFFEDRLGYPAISMSFKHRVSIEWKSPYKESYTVNSHRKSFDYILSDVRACVRFQN